MVLLRHEIGDVMRDSRLKRGMTLRDLADSANVSYSYLSELERGQKDASSLVLHSIARGLGVPLSEFLYEVADRLALFEDFTPDTPIPDTIPEDFYVEHVHE
jgi:transcriptional regulator with XRE-family HTH domain